MRIRLLPLIALIGSLPAEEFVPFQASEARLFLRVPEGRPPLSDLRTSAGQAITGPQGNSANAKARVTDVMFPISWWKWGTQTIQFTPAHDGIVELDLNGPWAEARPGVLRQQEVLWDQLEIKGAELSNRGFEEQSDGKPVGWESPWRPYVSKGSWPLEGAAAFEGEHLAASWHGRPLVGKMTVKANVPVTLTLHARAATIPGFKAPAILPKNTPAHRACAKLRRGVNLGNCWEAPPGTWGIKYDIADIDKIADQGFDHIRVPVAWQFYLTDYGVKREQIEELESVLKRALERNLTVILNWQHFDELVANPEAKRKAFTRGWRMIAIHFRDWPEQLYFELLNEPNGALDHETLSDIYAESLSTIRETNPERIILADPSQWASVRGLDRLRLPDADDRIIVTIHSYEPFQFTHQQAAWVNYQDLRGISYPGPPANPVKVPASLAGDPSLVQWMNDYNTKPKDNNPCSAATFEALLDEAVEWSEHFGRPIHIGEFGAYQKADLASRRRYVSDFRKAAEKRNLPWAMWDWKAGFGYWDRDKDQPILREALFGD